MAEQKLIYSHAINAGVLALPARLYAYESHGMPGVHFEEATGILSIPDSLGVVCAVAIGKSGEDNEPPGRCVRLERAAFGRSVQFVGTLTENGIKESLAPSALYNGSGACFVYIRAERMLVEWFQTGG